MLVKSRSLLRLILVLNILVTVTFLGGGCGIFGAFYGLFIHPLMPPEKVAAEYDMSDSKVLVWVDVICEDDDSPLLRRELTQYLQKQLIENQAVAQIIEYQQIAGFRRENPGYIDMTIRELGQKLQADDVLYVLIDQYQLHHEAGEEFYQSVLGGYSKVIDVATGQRQWPASQAHRPLTISGDFIQGQGESVQGRLMRQLCLQAARQIAPYFYEHKESR